MGWWPGIATPIQNEIANVDPWLVKRLKKDVLREILQKFIKVAPICGQINKNPYCLSAFTMIMAISRETSTQSVFNLIKRDGMG